MEENAKCPRCGFVQPLNEWIFAAECDYSGQIVAESMGGDHARCPKCGKLLHIDYDLLDE